MMHYKPQQDGDLNFMKNQNEALHVKNDVLQTNFFMEN